MRFKIINEDFNKDEIDNIHLVPGKDIDINIDDFEISIWWHTPSLNLSYYPIIQIDKGDKTVLNREGPENPDNWDRFAKESIKKVLTKYGKINEDYDDERMLYKRQLNAKINDVASDIAEYVLEIENPSNETIQGISDDLKDHKDTFIELINQHDILDDNKKEELIARINKLRL
jgi:hypothetical protein